MTLIFEMKEISIYLLFVLKGLGIKKIQKTIPTKNSSKFILSFTSFK